MFSVVTDEDPLCAVQSAALFVPFQCSLIDCYVTKFIPAHNTPVLTNEAHVQGKKKKLIIFRGSLDLHKLLEESTVETESGL